MNRLRDYKEKLITQLEYEKRDYMKKRLEQAIAYIDSQEMEINDMIKDTEWNCKRILSGER